MADIGTPLGSHPRLRAIGCACALAALVLPAEALAQATGVLTPAAGAKREAGGRPTAGSAVISYEESRGSGIVYLEESGGLVAPVAPGVVARRPTPVAAPAARPAATPAERAATRQPRNERPVTRQVADAEGVAAPAR